MKARRREGEKARRWGAAALTAMCALSLLYSVSPSLLAAQQPDLEQSRKRLDDIKRERQQLERQQLQLQNQVSDASATLRNLERQRDATNRLVNEIEHQMSGLSSELDRSSAELALAQDNLAARKAILQKRLDQIYRRGPLYTFQVLLTAESFGDLLTRYKYLYLESRQDRALVDDVTRLTESVRQQRDQILGVRTQLDERRTEHEAEVKHFDQLAADRQTELNQLQRNSQQTHQKLTAIEKDEATVTDLLASLEKAARNAAASRAARPETVNAPTPGSLSTADIGRLDWPVDGNIVINFGPDTLKDGGVVRWTGIGIAAPLGTPVRAVAAGKVMRVQRLSTYGLGVVLQHGNGYYSLYWQLQSALVKEGQEVARGAVLGTVGGQNSALGQPHLYFEIRGENQIALDPIAWLKSRK